MPGPAAAPGRFADSCTPLPPPDLVRGTCAVG